MTQVPPPYPPPSQPPYGQPPQTPQPLSAPQPAPQPAPPAPQPIAAPYVQPSSSDRVRLAWQRRHETDYVLEFWSAFGWTVLTLGVYAFYVTYRMAQRDQEHNRRRIELLDAATSVAWEQAHALGLADELTPAFQRIAGFMQELRRLSTEFRDPGAWTLLDVVTTGIARIVLWVFVDQDLVRHDRAEGAIEAELAVIYARLGAPIAAPNPARLKDRHNYVARILVLFPTIGFYALWWLNDLMIETNRHFEHNWAWEDDLARGIQQMMATA